MKFIGYRMTHDTGFAPNPFFGALTLATCKPTIRRTKIEGDWVAGFVSKALAKNSKNQGVTTVREEGLVYLMKIGEIIPLDDYFNDLRFAKKKPIKNNPNPIKRSGDNIYRKINGEYFQLPNNSHDNDLETITHDSSGDNVLIADMNESYYFGRKCPIPEGGWEKIGFRFSKGRTFYCSADNLANIKKFLYEKGFKPGIHGEPCLKVAIEEMATNFGKCSNR